MSQPADLGSSSDEEDESGFDGSSESAASVTRQPAGVPSLNLLKAANPVSTPTHGQQVRCGHRCATEPKCHLDMILALKNPCNSCS